VDPTGFMPALQALTALKKALDSAAIRARIEEITTTVDMIGRHLAENTMAELHAGFTHLEVAMAATEPQLRSDELGFARQAFNRLASRSGDDSMLDQYAAMSVAHVSALGHLGNVYYFILRDQPEQALISAYSATERFPALGVNVLPPALFSRNWRSLAPRIEDPRTVAQLEFANAKETHSTRRRTYRLDMAWRVPVAAGAVLAGLVGATVSPSLAGHGVMHAIGLLSTSEQGLLPTRGPVEQHYLDKAAAAQRRLEPIVVDAQQRRAAVLARLQRADGAAYRRAQTIEGSRH